jgi:hypothetical protein
LYLRSDAEEYTYLLKYVLNSMAVVPNSRVDKLRLAVTGVTLINALKQLTGVSPSDEGSYSLFEIDRSVFLSYGIRQSNVRWQVLDD